MNTRLQPYLLVALCWACCLTSSNVFAQDSNVYEGDLKFFTQAELDTFSYTRVKGDLTIGTFSDTLGTGTSLITDLSPLQTLERVDGAFLIGLNNKISTLKGLEGLCRVDGPFLIYGNDQLTTLEGLNRLHHVGGNLTIEINDRLQSLRGLEKLESVGDNIYIDTNEALATLSGLDNLRKVDGLISIGDNDALINLEGLGGLDSLGRLGLIANDLISSLSGLNPSVTILGGADFTNNPKLAECCVVLDNVQGTLSFSNNATGCSSLAEVQQACRDEPVNVDCAGEVALFTQAEVDAFDCTSVKDLTISVSDNDDPITNLKALCSLVTVEENLMIEGGSQLTSLEGLHKLTTIGGRFSISASGITNFAGLGALTSVGTLAISDAGLTSFRGLDKLRLIRGFLEIRTTHELTNFKGLENLRQISGTINLIDTRIASYEGLSGLETVGGLSFSRSFEVEDFTGLSSLKRITADIFLGIDNDNIWSFKGLENVERIGDIFMRSSVVPTFEGLGNLRSVGSISVENSELVSFKGLGTVQVDNDLSVIDSEKFIDPSALSDVQRIGGSLILTGNTNLGDCCVLPALASKVDGDIILENNAESCNSLDAIAENCDEPVTGVDCSQEEIILTTQAEVDAFDCTSVKSLVIRNFNPDTISNLDALQSLVAVENDLIIDIRPGLNNLESLSNLTSIGGDFTISGQLGSLKGLEQLTSIDGSFKLEQVGELRNFAGLENLERIGGDLAFTNYELDNFEGLSNLKAIGGRITFFDQNNDISFVGLSALESVGGFDLEDANIDNFVGLSSLKKINGSINAGNTEDNIASFEGLENVEEITGNITLAFGNIESWTGLRNLRRIGGDFEVEDQRFETFEGLEKLKEIGGTLYLLSNGVESLQAFESLQSVGGVLIEAEPLTSLDGLEQLRRVNGNFSLVATQVADITAIQNIESIARNLGFTFNEKLSDCCIIPSLADRVQGSIILERNAPACSSLEAIEENCDRPPVAAIDCSQETIVLTTQAEVDAFDCTIVSNLIIDTDQTTQNPITSLAGLSTLTSVINNLDIRANGNAQLASLEGLNNLTSVGGDFEFSAQLPNFTGLSSLESVGGKLAVTQSGIENFKGLEKLKTIGERFQLSESNPVNFEGLSSLTSVGGALFLGNLTFQDDYSLSFAGLSALESVGGIVFFDQNVAAKDFTGLESLKIIRGDLTVGGTDGISLGSLRGLERVEEITGTIQFSYQRIKDFQGLNNLQRIGGNIQLENNRFESFDGLENLEVVVGYISAFDNPITSVEGLRSLRVVGSIELEAPLELLVGLEQLRQVDGTLGFSYTSITDVSPLQGVENITGNLSFVGNSDLTECCIIPSLIAATQGEVFLSDNAPECSSLEAIEENCAQEAPDENARTAQDLHAFPNPSANFVQIQVDQPTVVQLFSTAGNLVKEQRVEQESILDLTTVKAGVYLLKTPGGRVQRIIKK